VNLAPGYGETPSGNDGAKANYLHLLRAFTFDPARHLQTVRLLLNDSGQTLLPVAVEFLLSTPRSPATDTLVHLLLAQGSLTSLLIDPGASSAGRALSLARVAYAADPSLDLRLAQVLTRLDPHSAEGRCQARRILFLLDAFPPSKRTLPVLMRLLRSDDSSLRSKAVKLIGAGKRDLQVLHAYAHDADPRVRANALESLWGEDTPELRAFFHYASLDPNPRVAVNAAIGLYFLQDRDAPALLERMAQSTDSRLQASAAWAMGRCRDPAFVATLRQLLESPHPVVRRSALRSLVAINGRRHPAA
jgi:hypothetical protein